MGAIPRSTGWPTLPALLVLGRFSSGRPVRAPGQVRAGAIPRGTGSHCAHLGASGRAEARPSSARFVLTYIQNCQLFVYSEVVSTYIQNYQLFVYVGASAARSRGGPEPPPCLLLIYNCRTRYPPSIQTNPGLGGVASTRYPLSILFELEI